MCVCACVCACSITDSKAMIKHSTQVRINSYSIQCICYSNVRVQTCIHVLIKPLSQLWASMIDCINTCTRTGVVA